VPSFALFPEKGLRLIMPSSLSAADSKSSSASIADLDSGLKIESEPVSGASQKEKDFEYEYALDSEVRLTLPIVQLND